MKSTPQIRKLIDRGLGENSPWVHDQSRANFPASPTPDELEAGLDCYRELLRALTAEQRLLDTDRKQKKANAKEALKAAETAPVVPPEPADITVKDARAGRGATAGR